jgi:hypothetical protein
VPILSDLVVKTHNLSAHIVMAFDAFISYSSKDKVVADATCAVLEGAGVRCWIAPRDVQAGTEYGTAIIDAIDHCSVMILVFSSSANESRQIHREIERAVSKGIPILPVRIEEVTPTKSMEYFLGAIHWLDALTPPLDQHLQRLAETVKAMLKVESAPQSSSRRIDTPKVFKAVEEPTLPAGRIEKAKRPATGTRFFKSQLTPPKALLAAICGIALMAALVAGIWLYHSTLSTSTSTVSQTPPAAGRGNWQNLGGSILEQPSCVSWGPNRIDCFARGPDRAMWHRWWDGSQSGGWRVLAVSSPPGGRIV